MRYSHCLLPTRTLAATFSQEAEGGQQNAPFRAPGQNLAFLLNSEPEFHKKRLMPWPAPQSRSHMGRGPGLLRTWLGAGR